ncbi:MAG: 1-deoxy-D-xylulose-5-phosphate reductoisomerase [Clostridia bacterium]|nr:1-deoxy-D-xylulose-5-phosphate reductoisomerase [Clostridia bacterium]
MSKTIAILGATGSVGSQALDVAAARGYKVDFLSANKDLRTLEEAARKFRPRAVAMADGKAASELRTLLADTNIKVLSGEGGIAEGIALSEAETVINATLGKAGLVPSLAVIDAGKTLALANKESLVIAGDIVMSRAKERGVEILPVDSEHSAIFQSLKSGKHSEIKRIILTASGGPFFGKSVEELRSVTLADTLAHPTWKMGRKITVDSATLMNKGFEIIEAAHLFGVGADRVKVVVHRESILHSAVEYIDNCIVGELSVPDMRMCIQYAVDYPERCVATSAELDLFAVGALTFQAPDPVAFPLLELARRAGEDGGASGAVLNAADEIAVEAFLNERISFSDISRVVIGAYESLSDAKNEHSLEAILEYDAVARVKAEELIKK